MLHGYHNSWFGPECQTAPPIYGNAQIPDQVFGTYTELRAFILQTLAEDPNAGVEPFDIPWRGEIGYLVLVKGLLKLVVWRPFGDIQTQEVELSMADTQKTVVGGVVQFMGAHRVFRCDRHNLCKVGFVHFDEPGVAHVLYLSLSDFRSSFDSPYNNGCFEAGIVLQWRDSLPPFRGLTGVASFGVEAFDA